MCVEKTEEGQPRSIPRLSFPRLSTPRLSTPRLSAVWPGTSWPSAAWQSPLTWSRYWLAGVYAGSAVYSVTFGFLSSDPVHREWGAIATCGYLVAALLAVALRGRKSRLAADLPLAASFLGTLLIPLLVMTGWNIGKPEVDVVVNSAWLLIHHGTPYQSSAALAYTTNPDAYNPYLPVMALFGLPRAIFGDGMLTDPRIWFGICFLAVFSWALRAGGAKDIWRWTIFVMGSPIVALELAVGGTDVPMVAFLCLGFGLLAKGLADARRPGTGPPEAPGRRPLGRALIAAGIALGIAAGMKATAWPGLAVAIVLLVATVGWRVAGRFAAVAVAVAAVCVGPFLVHPQGLVVNTIEFPLGLANIRSAAASPLPGHLLSDAGKAGHTTAVALLVLAGVAVVLILLTRPPRSVPRAVFLLVWAMSLMFLLAPSTRFGYFIYPGTLALWLLAVLAGRDARTQSDARSRRASRSGSTSTAMSRLQ
jgi:hypothetical protein